MVDILIKLDHKLRKGLIDDGFELVVLAENEVGQLMVVVDQIHEREDDMVLGIVHCVPCSLLVLLCTCGVAELLDESCEFTLHVATQHVLWQLCQSFNLHGA